MGVLAIGYGSVLNLVKVGSKLTMKRFINSSGDYDKRVVLDVEPFGFFITKEDVVHSIELAKFDRDNDDFKSGYTYLYSIIGTEYIIRL